MQVTPQVRDVFPLDAALSLAIALSYPKQTMALLLPAAAGGFTQALLERQG